MEDKSFDQAMSSVYSRVRQEIQGEVQARAKWVVGNTVSSLVADLAGNPLERSTRDILLLTKLTVLLEVVKDQKILRQEEVDELNAYLTELHTAYMRPA